MHNSAPRSVSNICVIYLVTSYNFDPTLVIVAQVYLTESAAGERFGRPSS